MDPCLVMGTNLWLGILNGPRLGDFEGFLVRNCNGEVLGRSDGFWLGGHQKYVSWSIKQVRGQVLCGFWCFGVIGG